MVGIELLEDGLWRSSHLYFKDCGPVSKGAKTRRFNILSSHNRASVGEIKWFTNWRKYCFYPSNSLFDDNCLAEIADFLDERTSEHMSRLPKIKREKELKMRKRLRKIQRLTEAKNRSTMVLSVKVPAPEKPVVEGRDVSQIEKLAPEVQGEL